MADTKISALTAVTSPSRTAQQIACNDTSNTTMAASGTTSILTAAQILGLIQASDIPTLNQSTTGTASNVTGTVVVGHGGTGATTLTGLVKGNGTSAFTAATAGTDYQAPITLTTTGSSGAATFSGGTLNIPQYSGGGSSPLIFACSGGTAVTNTTTATSIFVGTTTTSGSRTILANTLGAGSLIAIYFNGLISAAASQSLTVTVSLGGNIILSGTNAPSSVTGVLSYTQVMFIQVLSSGSSGTATGAFQMNNFGTTAVSGTTPTVGTPAPLNTTIDNLVDVKMQWGAASASDSWQLTGLSMLKY